MKQKYATRTKAARGFGKCAEKFFVFASATGRKRRKKSERIVSLAENVTTRLIRKFRTQIASYSRAKSKP